MHQSAELTIARSVLLERVVRIELTASAWKAEVLPLYDTRLLLLVELTGIEPATSTVQG